MSDRQAALFVALWVLLIVGVGGVLAIRGHRARQRNPLARRQKAAWRAFRSIGTGPAVEPQVSGGLVGETAVVLAQMQQLPSADGDGLFGQFGRVELHLHVRNHDGQGFFVIARSDNTTLIKPIDEGILKAILKDRYQPPARMRT